MSNISETPNAIKSAFNPDNIPAELKALPQWYLWKFENRGTGKPAKVPAHVSNGRPFDITKPENGRPFDETVQVFEACKNTYDGIGFILSASDGYTVI